MTLVKKLSKKASKKSTRKLKGGAILTKRPRGENANLLLEENAKRYRQENANNSNANNSNANNSNANNMNNRRIGKPTDRTIMFNDMLGTIGDDEILYDFIEFLGRKDPKVVQCHGLGIGECKRFLIDSFTDDFSGIMFKEGHWKGYEPKEPNVDRKDAYDSYKSELQRPRTDNFCQSYAAFLWATQGKYKYSGNGLEIEFVPKEYAKNAQKMAKLWLAWVNDICKVKGGEEWLNNSIQNGIDTDVDPISEGYNAQKLKMTLKEISENYEVAEDLSFSKS